MTLRSFLPWAGLVLSLVNGLPAELSAQLPIVRIGVVVDGPWERQPGDPGSLSKRDTDAHPG